MQHQVLHISRGFSKVIFLLTFTICSLAATAQVDIRIGGSGGGGGASIDSISISDPNKDSVFIHQGAGKFFSGRTDGRPVFNVKNFGAKGDGVTNDIAAIKDAATAINNAGGGKLYFPEGTYYVETGQPGVDGNLTNISSSLWAVIPISTDGFHIELGDGAHIKVLAGWNDTNLAGATTDTSIFLLGTTTLVEDFVLTGGKITWDTLSGTSFASCYDCQNGWGFSYLSVNRGEISNIEIDSFPQGGTFVGYVDGDGDQWNNIHFENVKVYNYGGAGHDNWWYVQGGNTFVNCHIESKRTYQSHCLYWGADRPDIKVIGCTFKGVQTSNKYALHIYGSSGGDIRNVVIKGNLFEDNLNPIIMQKISSTDSVRNVSIEGNIFLNGCNVQIYRGSNVIESDNLFVDNCGTISCTNCYNFISGGTVTGLGASNEIAYWNSASTLTSNNEFFISPGERLTAKGWLIENNNYTVNGISGEKRLFSSESTNLYPGLVVTNGLNGGFYSDYNIRSLGSYGGVAGHFESFSMSGTRLNIAISGRVTYYSSNQGSAANDDLIAGRFESFTDTTYNGTGNTGGTKNFIAGKFITNHLTSINKTGGTINDYGINVDVNGGTGVDNTYGAYIDAGGATNNWGVYVLNSSTKNYFAGNIGVGTTSPSEKLDITGNVKFSGALMPGGSAGTSGYLLQSQGSGLAPTWLNGDATYFKQGGNTFGTSAILGTKDNYRILFNTNDTTRIQVTSSGLIYFDKYTSPTSVTGTPAAMLGVTSSGQVVTVAKNRPDTVYITLNALNPGQALTQTAGTDFYDGSWLVPEHLDGYTISRVDYALTTNTSTTGSLTIGFRWYDATNTSTSFNNNAVSFSGSEKRKSSTVGGTLVKNYWMHPEVHPSISGTLDGTVEGLLITLMLTKQ